MGASENKKKPEFRERVRKKGEKRGGERIRCEANGDQISPFDDPQVSFSVRRCADYFGVG